MEVKDFLSLVLFDDLKQIDRVAYLAYYLKNYKSIIKFTTNQISSIMFENNYSKLNVSRINNQLRKSNSFLSDSRNKTFKLASKKENELTLIISKLSANDDIQSSELLLPINIFTEFNKNEYIRLVQQINSAYENNLFDACALLMARLLELLIIEYIELSNLPKNIINTDGGYIKFSLIINKAKSSSKISLSNKSYDDLHIFRQLGNLSAHKKMFYCRKKRYK